MMVQCVHCRKRIKADGPQICSAVLADGLGCGSVMLPVREQEKSIGKEKPKWPSTEE